MAYIHSHTFKNQTQERSKNNLITVGLLCVATVAIVAFACWLDGYVHEAQYLSTPVDIQRALDSGGLRLGN